MIFSIGTVNIKPFNQKILNNQNQPALWQSKVELQRSKDPHLASLYGSGSLLLVFFRITWRACWDKTSDSVGLGRRT